MQSGIRNLTHSQPHNQLNFSIHHSSGCPGVNWSGLECLWRLRRLKTLVLYDMEHVKDIELLCIMLLEIFPNLDIR